jgi:DNA-binding MarR family transcriptional regulator
MKGTNGHPAPPVLISLIGNLHNRMYKECDRIIREKGFPLEMDQLPVLLKLYYSGDASQQEISSDLKRDKASINRTVSFLVNKDIVVVIQDTIDKRKTRVALTASGKKLAGQAHTIVEAFNTTLSAALTAEESKQFQSITQKLIDSINSTQ